MKKILLMVGISFLSLAPYALAQSGFVPLAPIPGLTDISPTSVVNSSTLTNFFNNLYKYLIGLAAVIAVIQIIWAGLDIAYFHKDAVSVITDDKGKIYNAIFGLVLVLSPVLVFSIINPAILNLSLSLPELKTVSGTLAPTTQEQGKVTTPVTTGAGNPCGLINVGGSAQGNCTTTIFTEDTYATPPVGAWCYKLATPDNGKLYNCYRDQEGCRSSCRTTTCDSWLARDKCSTTQGTTCTVACVLGT